MDTTTGIITSLIALAFVLGMFFVAHIVENTSLRKKNEKKPEEKKVVEEKPVKTTEINDDYLIKEFNENNLANDMERLIEKDKKTQDPKNQRASDRSHLVKRGRMRDYYERKHTMRESKYGGYGVGAAESADNSVVHQFEDLTFTDEEFKKLIALQEVLKRKDS